MAEDIRIFIAILISDGLKRRIGLVQEEFKKMAPEVKWVAEDNFHVTMKFLGNVASDRLGNISSALTEAIKGVEPFDVEIGGVGAFPNPGRPRTIWVDVTVGGEILAELAKRVDNALEKLGFPREDRPFKSHITIGRLKDDRGARDLGPALRESKVGSLGSVRIDSVAVMRSELRREGPIYSKLSEIPLRKAGGEKDVNG
jgi:2'-5' RNA ligase